MENKAEETEKGKGSTEQTKKYITEWRNKWITSSAGSIDDFIKIYKNLAEQMQKWKEKGIILDPDVIGGVGDDYAQFCTYDEGVALQEEFEDEEEVIREGAFDNWDNDLEFEINKFITLKLIADETHIFINGERFNQCHYILLVDPDKNEKQGEIESIDEAQEIYKNDLETKLTPKELGITKEEEFWAHSSNLQAWAENDYNSRLLHRNLAFPLLKKLTEVGDMKAKKSFKEEIAERFASGHVSVLVYLLREKYLEFLTAEEFSTLLDETSYSKLNLSTLLTRVSDFAISDNASLFLSRVKAEFQDYFRENKIYIDIGKFKLDKSEFSPVVITPDSNYFIRGSDDGKLKEFNTLTGELERVFGDHNQPVFTLAISYEGRYIASSCDDTIKVWDYDSGNIVYILEGHQDAVNCLQFDPDGGYLVSGSADFTIKVWNLENGKVKKTLSSHWGDITSLAFSKDGVYLFSSALDNTINVWDTQKGRLLATLIDRKVRIFKVVIAKDNNFLVSASNSALKIWDIEKKKILREIVISNEDYDIHSFVLTPDDKFILAGLQGPLSEGWKLSMWRVADGTLVHEVPIKQNYGEYWQELNTLTISDDGVFIVGTVRGRMVSVWMDFLTFMEFEEGFRKDK